MKRKVVDFPDRGALEEQAGLWLIKLDGEDPPAAETIASLREWLSRGPAHRQELVELARLWNRMNVLTELAIPLGRPEEVRGGSGEAPRVRKAAPGARLAAAAAAVLVVGLTILYSVTWLESPDNGIYATAIGQQRAEILADGSVALLNTNSRISVNYTREARDIRLLQGEAEFTVTQDAQRPFNVYAGNERVQALGTAFTVHLKEGGVDVIVTEGEVALATLAPAPSRPPESSVAAAQPPATTEYVEVLSALRAGQGATLDKAAREGTDIQRVIDSIEVVEVVDLARRLSWRQGLLVFTGDPLEEVVQEINRYTALTIEIADPEVRAIRVGGQFPVGETDAMLDVLEENFGLRVTRLDTGRVLLSAATRQGNFE